MATVLNVHSRLPGKNSRFQITLPSLDDDTEAVISSISKEMQTQPSEFDVLHAGKVLKPGTKLSTHLLQEQSTVFVVRKFTKRTITRADTSYFAGSARDEVVMAIQSALLNQDYRNTVERVLLNPESVENVIAATPGLDRDPAVLLMLQDPELLAIIAHPSNLDKLIKEHPAFAHAAITVATVVNEESAKGGKKASRPGTVTYSLDQMSEDEDEAPAQASRPRGQTGGPSITASQLAAALQSAAGTSSQASTSGNNLFSAPFQSGPSASNSGSGITSDFFQQAMAHAQTASSDAALQQLRDMGITDDNVARQALAVTNGDIQAAIDLIFGDGFM